MGDLFSFLMSWPGLMTAIVFLFVIDSIFNMGWLEKVKAMLGQDSVPTNKELDLRLRTLEGNGDE